MGNRTEIGRYPQVINPSEAPFLHIIRGETGYEYIANLYGVRANIGYAWWDDWQLKYDRQVTIQIPLLPPIEQIPPPSFDTQMVVGLGIYEKAPELLGILNGGSYNVIALSHGSYWSLLPEEAIANLLQVNGYQVEKGFPRTGGRKRIQEHAILIER